MADQKLTALAVLPPPLVSSDLIYVVRGLTSYQSPASVLDAKYLQVANDLSDLNNAATARANLGLAIGTNVQAFDAFLTSIALLGTAADRMIYTTAVDTAAETALTPFARSILDDANEAAFKATVNLEIGVDVQAWDADLDTIAGLAKTDGNFIVGDGAAWTVESGATARASLGLGTIATQNANNVTISGGSITGITDLAIADGGTGQSTAQLGINALTNVAAATNEHVLTKDTATGNAIFKAATGGSSLPVADTQTLVMGSADNTKLLRFEIDGFTEGATRVLTPPNADILLAGQNFANSFSAAQTFTTFTTSGDVGIRSALDSRYGIFLDDTQSLSGTLRAGQRISIFHAMISGNSRSWGLSIAQTTANTGDAEDIYGIRADVSVGNTGATSLAVGVGNTVSMTGAGAISAFYGGLYTAKINGGLAGSVTTFVCSEAQLEIGAGATTTITNAYIMRGSNFISGGTIGTLYGLFVPSVTQGSTNYAILTNAGLVKFGDRTEIEQPSTTAAVPTLKLTQLDLSEDLIEFSAAVATGNPIEAIGAKTLTTTHFIRVSVNGSFVYIPVGTIA